MSKVEGKTSPPAPVADEAQRDREPELWKAFQSRGAIELLTLLSADEELRMREVLQSMPVMAKQTVVSRLHEFSSLGIVNRRVDEGPPVSTWYSLTPTGTELAVAAKILLELGDRVAAQDRSVSD